MSGVTGQLLFGFLLGLRHALEPDHLAALATFVAERPGARRGALLGASWGIGHGGMLLTIGGALLLARQSMPGGLATGFECGVALLLILLGARGIARALLLGRQGPDALHQHGPNRHVHRGVADHVHVGAVAFARRPLLVGLAHGLAGSGALAALTVAQAPSPMVGMIFITLFGLGSIAGMSLLAGVAGWPLNRLARSPRMRAGLGFAASTLSLCVGFAWGLPLAAQLLGR